MPMSSSIQELSSSPFWQGFHCAKSLFVAMGKEVSDKEMLDFFQGLAAGGPGATKSKDEADIDEIRRMIQSIEAKLESQPTVEVEWLSVDRFAKLIGKSEWTTRQYCVKGLVKSRKIGTGPKGGWRVHKDEVKRVLEEGATVQVQPPYDPNDN